MIKAHLLSLFSFRSYHSFSKATKWQILWFWLYLFLLGSLVFNLYFNNQVSKNLPAFINSFPQVTFEKGVLTAPNAPVFAPVTGTPFHLLFDKSLLTPPPTQEFLDKKVFLIVGQKNLYLSSGSSVDSRPLPTELNFTTTPEFMQQHQSALKSFLGAIGFLTSFILCGAVLLFGFCLAGSVGFFLRAIFRRPVPTGELLRWAAFLQGPVLTLWLLNLFIPVPMFTLAVIILCIIYMQQILNTWPNTDAVR